MKSIKSATTQFVAMEEGERLKQWHLMSFSGTGWQGMMFIDIVKNTAHAGWPTGEVDKDGSQMIRLPSAQEVVARASDVVNLAVAEMDKNGWTVAMMPAEDLLDETSGRVGFVGSRNGEADKSGKALPGAGDAAAPDRGRGQA